MLFSALIGINAAMALAGAIGTSSYRKTLPSSQSTDNLTHPLVESGVSTIFVGLGEDP